MSDHPSEPMEKDEESEEQKKYKAEEDHRTLIRAHEIVRDPERLARVKSLHQEHAEALTGLDKLRAVAKKKLGKNDDNKAEEKAEHE